MMNKICTDGSSLDNSSIFSAEAVGNNEDLIREIFLRLPIRSLIRFKLVSKCWSSLISDPQFARDRTRLLNPNSIIRSGLFIYNPFTKSREIESVSLDDSPIEISRVRVPSLSFLDAVAGIAKLTILHSCNGLLLCRFKPEFRIEYCVCNPTTKKFKILPQLILVSQELSSGCTLAFDPSISPHYKVVCVNYVSYGNSQIKIYSSETCKWSTSTYGPYQLHYGSLYRSGFYWNGSIYWTNYSDPYYSYEYDIEKQNVKGFDMPNNPQSNGEKTVRYFGEFKGCLHLVYIQRHYANKNQVLERDRETSKWTVKYHVNISHLVSKFPEICVKRWNNQVEYAFSILSVYKGEKEEDSALVLTIPGKVVSYNLHYKTSKLLCELPSQFIDTFGYYCFTGFNFIESFASV